MVCRFNLLKVSVMKAFEIVNKALSMTERDKPVPAEGEALIRIHAAGINRPDIFQRMGNYPPPPGVTDIPGLEIAGVIETAPNGSSVKPGDKVVALVAGGGYAEYAAVPLGQILLLPNGFDFVQGAALPETFFTVWTNLFDSGQLKRGERILIHGGSSGIGTAAIQIAKLFDCTVYTTAGSVEKCKACEKAGADFAINYKEEDFVEEVLSHAPDGVDVILDMVGGDYYARNIACMAPFGRLVSIAMLNGKKGEVDIPSVMRKRLTLTGSTLRARSVEEKTQIAHALSENIWPALNRGQIAPVIDSTYPFSQAEDAHQRMIDGNHIGKIVLSLE